MSRPDTDDPNVARELKDGRLASDIMLIGCPYCGDFTYYNQGTHASCSYCGNEIEDLEDAITLEEFWDFEPYPCDDK